jgi:hypothetical protein
MEEIQSCFDIVEKGNSKCCNFLATRQRQNQDFYCEWCCEKCDIL